LHGLILSNALRAQKDAEDEGCVMALSNLRSEVIELRNEGLEKDKILYSLINRIKEDKATFNAQAEAQKREIEDLRKQLARAKEERTLEEAKREIRNNGQIIWRKMLKSFVHLRKDATTNLWNVLKK
jgi:predicted RNase H-like nuclease (RuvC/YqgF family)